MAYHAGLGARQRESVYQRFEDKRPLVVVATTAFGMGIDAPHVRAVLHLGAPESVDAYYQEFGRAGRDGKPANAVLFRRTAHAGGRRFFGGTGAVPADYLLQAATRLRESQGPMAIGALVSTLGGHKARALVALDLLEKVGAVRVSGRSQAHWPHPGLEPSEAAARAADLAEAFRSAEKTRHDMVQRYVQSEACRWQMVLGYFGQPTGQPCQRCDNCDRGRAVPHGREGHPFPLNSRARHRQWGAGAVVAYDDGTMTMLFDDGTYRTLSVELVTAGNLLRPINPGRR